MSTTTTKRRASRNQLGTIRKRPSGRYSASYRADGREFTAPRTFATKTEAEGWLATERADRLRGTWRDPHSGQITLETYARDWLASRAASIAERTHASNRHSLTAWILPRIEDEHGSHIELGRLELSKLSPAVVRRWFTIASAATRAASLQRLTYTPTGHPARLWAREQGIDVPATGRPARAIVTAWRKAGAPLPAPQLRERAHHIEPGRATAAMAYGTLHTLLNAAVEDGLIPTNPCRIRGASTHTAHERGTCSPDEVAALANGMPAHLRAAVLVAAWSALRHGELFALARRHVDLDAGTIRVERSLSAAGKVVGRTKTQGSIRTVWLPRFITDELAAHMQAHTGPGPDALIFTTATGRPYTSRAISPLFKRAREAIGRPELHWHDLRHTGATLAYREGASVRDVQRRLGHSTARAAMIYAHTADESDALLAQRLNESYGELIQFPKRRAS